MCIHTHTHTHTHTQTQSYHIQEADKKKIMKATRGVKKNP
jgi:hypothetical protein